MEGEARTEMREETWKDVPGFEGYYLVSNLGKVYSTRNEKILKSRNSHGYRRVNLSANGKRESWTVHRLVAMAFIPNPENKPTVNHINEIKDDNRVENLEWATIREQNIHGTRVKRAKEHTDYKARKIDYKLVASKHDYGLMGEKFSKKVEQYNSEGIKLRTFNSITQASEATGISKSHICSCINGNRLRAGGYIWKNAT